MANTTADEVREYLLGLLDGATLLNDDLHDLRQISNGAREALREVLANGQARCSGGAFGEDDFTLTIDALRADAEPHFNRYISLGIRLRSHGPVQIITGTITVGDPIESTTSELVAA